MQLATKERVLVVDDEPQVLVALEDLLADEFNVLKATSAELALDTLTRENDIAVLVTDQRMPRMTGDELLARIGKSFAGTRILLTGFADLNAVIRAVNEGQIFAYVTKPWDPNDLRIKVHHAADRFRLAHDLANERTRLRDQTHVLHSILDSMSEGVVVADASGKFVLFNKQAAGILGSGARDVAPSSWAAAYGMYMLDEKTLLPPNENVLLRAMAGETVRETEVFVRNDRVLGARIAMSAAPLFDERGDLKGGVAVLRDVTEHHKLEEQFRQSQKMDAIGHLAGGIAHDFNNLLAVISGYCDLLLVQLPREGRQREDVGEMQSAVRRAAALTRQLLAMSRKQVVTPRVLDLNEVVMNISKMFVRLIGENIRLETTLAPAPLIVRIDEGQMEQVLMNLVVNARDAMPHGGRLTIATSKGSGMQRDDGNDVEHVVLSVTDTGIGMDARTQAQIFEPFFTTKEVGKGTGLGLSTVYGIVKQNGGRLEVRSKVGQGTSFDVYLPALRRAASDTSAPRAVSRLLGRAAVVLIVEDEEAVGNVAARILRSQGHTVLVTRRPEEARAICAARAAAIDLLLTDVVMPDVSGPELAQELFTHCPQMRVLYMSGYSGSAGAAESLLPEGAQYIEKPFTAGTLTERVRETLDQTVRAG